MDVTNLPTLEQFPRIPVAGQITVAESNSQLHSVPSGLENPATARGFCPLIVNYKAVDGHQLTSRLPFKIPSIRTSMKPVSLIVERNQGIPKALWDSWREEGLKGVNACLMNTDRSKELSNTSKVIIKVAASITSACLMLYDSPSNFLTYLFPHLELKIEDVNEEFSVVRRWKESWVRAMAWHPNAPYLAIALKDDSIRCCIVGNDVVPMMRCQEQRNVCSISWRPNVSSELAVGCEDCIIIWQPRTSISMKAGKEKAVVLRVGSHGPVNCVEYSKNSLHLLSSSAKDSSVYIWDACNYGKTPLKRIGGGGFPQAIWSPSGNRFLATSPVNAFWIWENRENWQSKRWGTPKSRVEAACWNPSGSILLFATGGFIYGIFFELSPVDRFVAQTDSIVKPVFNIKECHVFDDVENLEYKVGGKVRQMLWDENGLRVAVMFDDSELIAIFRVLPKSRSEILSPLGFVRGHPDESPHSIAFQKGFEDGALLTIAWTSGRIQHFPMIFALPSRHRNMLHEENYRTENVAQGRPSTFAAAGFVSPRLSVSGAEAMFSSQNMSELINQPEEAVSSSRLFSVSRNWQES